MYHYTAMNRKDQHVGLANRQFTMEPAKDFAETRFVHQSLPEMKVDDVDMSTTVAGIKMDVP